MVDALAKSQIVGVQGAKARRRGEHGQRQHSIGPLGVLPGLLLGGLPEPRGRSVPLALVVVLLVVGLTISRGAEAQPVAAPEPKTPQVQALLPPKPLPPVALDTFTPYPRRGVGASVVVLELLISVEGQATEPRVLHGEAPFARAAVAASAHWKFSPARQFSPSQQAGQAVAARIRFRVEFSQPREKAKTVVTPIVPTVVVPTVGGANRSQVHGGQPLSSAEPIEVFVQGRVIPGSRSLGQGEVRMLPGAFGDPFRAISVLPGVAPLVTGLPVSYVRGAPPGNIGFSVDGIRLPLLFHAFLGPSVVHPRLLSGVKMHAGGYPAEVGRYAGAVIDADLAEPANTALAEVSVRLVDAGAYVESPFDEGRGQVVLAGRYSYTALLLSMLTEFELRYWDYQALVRYELSDRDSIRIFALGALDFAGQTGEQAPDEDANEVGFHRLNLRYDRQLGDSTRASIGLTMGRDSTQGSRGSVSDQVAGLRFDLRSQLGEGILLRAGASAMRDEYELSLQSDSAGLLDVVTLFPSRVDSVWGGHADLVVELTPGLQWTPGLRVDRYRSGEQQQWAVSPRMALRTQVSERFSVEHAIGLAHQAPNYVPGIPGVAVAGLPGGLQRAVQTSAGLLGQLAEYWEGNATVFYNATFGLTDPFSLNQDLALDSDEAAIRSLGRSFGLELSLQRRFSGGFGGMLSYTLSRSLRSHDKISTLSGYDRPHVLNVALTQELGRGWTASGRALAYSGIPGSRLGEGTDKLFDQSRAQPFFRLDARLEKRFVFGARTSWTIVAEVLNASLSREVLRRSCEGPCQEEVVGPIFLPSLGLIGRF